MHGSVTLVLIRPVHTCLVHIRLVKIRLVLIRLYNILPSNIRLFNYLVFTYTLLFASVTFGQFFCLQYIIFLPSYCMLLLLMAVQRSSP